MTSDDASTYAKASIDKKARSDKEKYCFTVSDEGQASLNILEKSFNDQTKYFLSQHGLKSGLSILDIGCDLGYMSQYLAEIVGDNGRVTAIDNSENQIKAAKMRCLDHLRNRINWVVADHTKQVAIPNTEIKQITAAANKAPYKLFM